MFLSRGSRALRTQFQICKGMSRVAVAVAASGRYPARAFHMTRNLQVIKPVLLADIGEGEKARKPNTRALLRSDRLSQALSSARSSNGS